MTRVRCSLALPLVVLLLVPFGTPAAATDVNVNLFATGFEFHLDSPTNPPEPTITVTVGDTVRFLGDNVIRIRVENQDATLHTLTVPHFGVNQNLSAGAVIFVNITATTADAGRWQFWCNPHSSGATPETHTGMIGFIQVNEVDVDLIAAGFEFRLDSPTSPADPTITANVGDLIRFRIENQDAALHTFTAPHFGLNVTLAPGAVAFVNITIAPADAGTWQFWCNPHSSGATPETHTGMIGSIQVNSPPTPPRQPGFEAFVAILAAGTAFALLAVRRARKKA